MTPPHGVELAQVDQLQALFDGQEIDASQVTPSTTRGLSPNQLIMALVIEYGIADGADGARDALLRWFGDQARAFLRREQAGYRDFYEISLAVCVRLAWRQRDEEVYRHALRWWKAYVAYCSVGLADGKTFIPGSRQGNPDTEGPRSESRDLGRLALRMFDAGLLDATRFKGSIYPHVRMLIELRKTSELPHLDYEASYIPRLRDTLIARWWPNGIALHVPTFRPADWPASGIPPIEGAPWWAVLVRNQDGKVLDAVSWRTDHPERTWAEVAHANIAGYDMPRDLRVPASWGEPHYTITLDGSRPIPPLPPLPANWPTTGPTPTLPKEEPTVPTRKTPGDYTRDEILAMSEEELEQVEPDAWGGAHKRAKIALQAKRRHAVESANEEYRVAYAELILDTWERLQARRPEQ